MGNPFHSPEKKQKALAAAWPVTYYSKKCPAPFKRDRKRAVILRVSLLSDTYKRLYTVNTETS